jgi:hypothetical protein
MATWNHKPATAPTGSRALELWLQHAAGFILFEDVRRYAMEQIDSAVSAETRAAIEKGIDAATYGLMMVLDGVTGALSNAHTSVELRVAARLVKHGSSGDASVLAEIDLAQGDGMCMGYHGWLEGDFGEAPVVTRPPKARRARATGDSPRTAAKSKKGSKVRSPKAR